MIAPDLAEPIVAWRAWAIDEYADPPRLASPMQGDLWPAREPMEAVCVPRPPRRRLAGYEPPDSCKLAPGNCGRCSLYGLDRRGFLPRFGDGTLWVWGRCALWGKVVLHEFGARAQFGYPMSLFVPRSTLELMEVDIGIDGAFETVAGLFHDYAVPGQTEGVQPMLPGFEKFPMQCDIDWWPADLPESA